MKKILIALAVVCLITVAGALNFHFVFFDSSIKILKKTELTFTDTFVNARGNLNKVKLLRKPALLKAGIKDLFKKEKRKK